MTTNANVSGNSVTNEEIPLKLVLDQSKEIKDNVKKAAEQINLVNTALKQEEKISHPYPTIEEVIAQNEEAEQRVTKAAEDLHQVNTELAKHVAERIDIELELQQTKSELLDIRADLSKSQVKEKDALHIALHDSLTGLPNRLLLEQHLDHGLTQARRYSWKLAILFIDLDKFKNVNDSYGHDIGDKVLITVAERLQASVRAEDMVCRWGGDEFICVLLNVNYEDDVINLANKMVEQISQECNFDGTVVSITATVGIALCPRDGETAEILFRQVDRAMYKSKGTDQRVTLFDAAILENPIPSDAIRRPFLP
ncbi:GGDEF domain-containing protein [Pseudanabaena mucicola]|uniref:Diguanylate cyclase n=1 Tax=Pseudanabaena mucicola FACHB-723 TaxID=2692860 RepID=A0ABR7ZY27_9CYAN|nr:GGDEF domain-containing protein [Pseudanabaena mucicola]MBD2188469.1 diguanylate cyclase [Pseudanabaena mucicola FACHB-723]